MFIRYISTFWSIRFWPYFLSLSLQYIMVSVWESWYVGFIHPSPLICIFLHIFPCIHKSSQKQHLNVADKMCIHDGWWKATLLLMQTIMSLLFLWQCCLFITSSRQPWKVAGKTKERSRKLEWTFPAVSLYICRRTAAQMFSVSSWWNICSQHVSCAAIGQIT